jgi:hypothetical protein
MRGEPKSLKEGGENYIKRFWPNLAQSGFEFKSVETTSYNCVTWVNKIQTDRVDYSHDEEGNPQIDEYFYSAEPYIKYFKEHGFEICDNSDLEDGFEKIAIYKKNNDFKHVARQLPNGKWTSKMGDFEDIEHTTLEAVEGYLYKFYTFGKVSFFMKRKIVINEEL